jgi:hypothetical protein
VGVPGESNWRRCTKCQALCTFRAGYGDSVCPADGRKHSAENGLGYAVYF